MKAIIQRCKSASVTVAGEVISQIGRGMMVLIGIGLEDTPEDVAWISKRLLAIKLFPEAVDDEWGWKKNVVESDLEVLCVSQFTLMATIKKGAKPDFRLAMTAEQSKQMYHSLLDDLKSQYKSERIFDGRFGAMMDVQLINDGPATLIIDSREQKAPSSSAISTPGTSTPPNKAIDEGKKKRKETFAAQVKAKQQAREDQAATGGAEEALEPTPKAQNEVDTLGDRMKAAMLEQY